MPYVNGDRRRAMPVGDIIRVNREKDGSIPVGDLNYMITKILLMAKPKSYAEYNALVGVLECCKLEFYRRAVAAYEDEKIQENGDVY